MTYKRNEHHINDLDFYPLTNDELSHIRKIKYRRSFPFIIIGFAIIFMTLFSALVIGSNSISGFIPFLVFSSVGWIFLIVSVCQIFCRPEGGRYATIVSCYATQETTGTGENETTSTTHYFTVRFDDTGEVIENFTGSMYADVFKTGSRVFVVKNKKGSYDVFSAEPLIASGIYSPSNISAVESEYKLPESGARTAFIDNISFYELSDADVQSIKSLRKKQFKTLLIVIAFMAMIPSIFMTVFSGISFIQLIILTVSAVVIGYLFKKLLTRDPREEYSARHVIIKDKRTESVMYSSGQSSNISFYTFETTDTREILSDIKVNDEEALIRRVGTEVILAKDKKGMYKLFNI